MPGPERNRTTMQDVAMKAGVSKTTVSHALNRTRPVEESTRRKIDAAVRELGYVPNQAARSLNGKGLKVLGMIITDIRESFYSQIVKTMEEEASRLGFNIMICSSEDELEKETRSLDLLCRKGMDLLVHSPVHRKHSRKAAAGTGIPVIEIDRLSEGRDGPFVGIPNREAAAESAGVLLTNGCRRPGMISFSETVSTMTERCAGYRKALAGRGFDPLVLHTDSRTPEVIRREIRGWIETERPDGLICGNETISLAAVQAVREMGLNIPADMKIIGFDDNPWMAFLSPPLSVVRQPTERIARELMKLVELSLSPDYRKEGTIGSRIIVPAELILRGSCGSEKQRVITIKGD